MWKTSWAWCMMRIGIYSKIEGIKFQKFNIATGENINGTANYSMWDFELYLTGKITSYVFGSGNRGQSCNYCFYFLFSGCGYLFMEEAIKSGQLPISTQRSLAHSFVLLLQLFNSIILFPFVLCVQKLLPQAKGQPHYRGLLGTGLREKFFSPKLQ